MSFDPGLGYIFVNTRSVGTNAHLVPTNSQGILSYKQGERTVSRSGWIALQRAAMGVN